MIKQLPCHINVMRISEARGEKGNLFYQLASVLCMGRISFLFGFAFEPHLVVFRGYSQICAQASLLALLGARRG